LAVLLIAFGKSLLKQELEKPKRDGVAIATLIAPLMGSL
jgi:hypothetical protein